MNPLAVFIIIIMLALLTIREIQKGLDYYDED